MGRLIDIAVLVALGVAVFRGNRLVDSVRNVRKSSAIMKSEFQAAADDVPLPESKLISGQVVADRRRRRAEELNGTPSMTQATANGTKRTKAVKPPKQRAPKASKDPEGRMPLVEHIRELRTRLFRASLAITAGAIAGWFVHDWVIKLLSRPVCNVTDVQGVARNAQCHAGVLTVQSSTDGLAVSLKVSLLVGLLLSSPVWLYQLWAFIAPGLHKKEKKYSLGFVGVAVPLFVGGAVLCYAILPQIMTVLLGFTPKGIAVAIPLGTYIGTVTRMVLIFGCSMEVPLIVVALNFTGVLSAERLKKTWRYVTFGIFIFAAAAVPTGEPLGMTALAAPMCALYYSAIGIAVLNDRRRAARAAAAPSPDEASSLDLTPQEIESARAARELAARETRDLTSRDYDDLT